MVFGVVVGLANCGSEREPVVEELEASSAPDEPDEQSSDGSDSSRDVMEYISLLGNSSDAQAVGGRKKAAREYRRAKKAAASSGSQLGRALGWGRLGGVGFRELVGLYGQYAKGFQGAGKAQPMSTRVDMALAAAASGGYAAAAALCNVVVSDKKSDPKSQSSCYGVLGALSALKGNQPRAAAYYTKSLDLDSSMVGSRLNLAYLCLQAGLVEEADGHLRKISSKHWLVLFGRAESARVRGNYKQAAKLAQQVIKKAPKFSPALFSLGMSMLGANRPTDARKNLSLFLKKSQDKDGREVATKYLKVAERSKAK